jgi:hypothetical protein
MLHLVLKGDPMIFNQQELEQGMSDGFGRAGAFYSVSPQLQRPDIENALKQVLNTWPVEANDRFVRLFAELATIAATARSEYKEPPLSQDGLRTFLAVSSWFLNSFTHK